MYICVCSSWYWTKHWEAPAPHSVPHGWFTGLVTVEGHDLHVDMSWVDLSAKSFFMRRLHYFHYALNDSFHTSVWMSVKIVSHPGHGAIWRKLDWSAHTATHMQVQADSDISIKTYVMCVNVDVWRYCVIPCNANSHLCWLLEVVSLNGIHYSIWSPVIWR